MSVKKSCFSDCLKVLSVDPVFKNVRESSTAENYRLVSLLSAFSTTLEKLVNNNLLITNRNVI